MIITSGRTGKSVEYIQHDATHNNYEIYILRSKPGSVIWTWRYTPYSGMWTKSRGVGGKGHSKYPAETARRAISDWVDVQAVHLPAHAQVQPKAVAK